MRWYGVVAVMALVGSFTMLSAADAAVQVYAAQVRLQPLADDVEALGTLRADEHVTLASTVTETVTAIHFDDNQRVKAGALLVELDAREEEAQLLEEEAKLAEAQRQVKRLEPLAAKGAASQADLDANRLEAQTAEARIRAIRSRIALRRIRAPFDGVVGLRNISVGALVQGDTPITTVDANSVMKLDFTVPSRYLTQIRTGIPIRARSVLLGAGDFNGSVTAIGSRIDPVSRAVTVRARIPNPQRLLKPGLLMQVTLQLNAREGLLLPEACILQKGTEHFVMTLVKAGEIETVEQRKVRIGSRRRGSVEIVEGLDAGERVVAHGLMKVRPGAPVSVGGMLEPGGTVETLMQGARPSEGAR